MNSAYLLLLSTYFVLSNQQWLDPHDMNSKLPGSLLKTDNVELDGLQQCNCPKEINFSISHYKRLINLILSVTSLDTAGVYKGQLYLNVPPEDFDILKGFADDINSKEDSAILRKLDQILSKSLTKPFYERAANIFESWMDRIYYAFYSRTTTVFLSCLLIVFVSYKLLVMDFTLRSVVAYLLFVGWGIDFGFTWMNLLQEAEINRMADSLQYQSVPPHCNPSTMNFWQYLKYSLSSKTDCRDYHQVIFKDNFWSVAPVTVISHQFGILIYTPASLLGQALGTFTTSLLNSLPWGINIILLPVLLLFVAIIICISISFLTQTSFNINFFHLIRLQFGNEQRRIVGDVLSGQNLNAILNIAHRNMVEDIRQVENSKADHSNSSKYDNPLQIKNDKVSDINIEKTEEDEQINCKSKEKEVDCSCCVIDSNAEVKHDGSGDKL